MTERKALPGAEKRSIPVFAIAVGLVVFLGAFAAVFTILEGRDASGIEVAAVGIAGDPLPVFRGEDPDPAVGLVAPRIAGITPAGDDLMIEAFDEPIAVVVLAHWCPYCQREVTEVTRWLEETGGVDGVTMLAISTRAEPLQMNYPPSQWLEREGWPVPTVVDDGDASAAMALGMSGTPYWVFVDADGHVALRVSGLIEIDVLESILTDLAGS